MQALKHALATLKQQAEDVTGHRPGGLVPKIKALLQALDDACALLGSRRYKTELFEVLEPLPTALACHQVLEVM
jgi:hypothetical protein